MRSEAPSRLLSSRVTTTSIRRWFLACSALNFTNDGSAAAYANEGEVGDGIKDSGVPRESFWLTTKLDNMHHKRAEAALEDSLKNLKTDYLDLWLMHWPCSVTDDTQKVAYDDWNYIDTW